MEFEKGKSYSEKDIKESGCIFCKYSAAVMFYRKAKMLFVFDKTANEKKEFKLLTISEDQFDYMY